MPSGTVGGTSASPSAFEVWGLGIALRARFEWMPLMFSFMAEEQGVENLPLGDSSMNRSGIGMVLGCKMDCSSFLGLELQMMDSLA